MSVDQSSLDKLVKRLKRFSEADSASGFNEKKTERCLAQLQSMRLTVPQLQQSGLAAIVNRLRKRPLKSESALKMARRLIKDWRLAVEEAQVQQTTATVDRKPATLNAQKKKKVKEEKKKTMKPAKATVSAEKKNAKATGSGSSVRHHLDATVPAAAAAAAAAPDEADAAAGADVTTSDPVRIKCLEMLQQALEQAQTPTTVDAATTSPPRRLAVTIESVVFADQCGAASSSSDAKYKARMRSLLMNLRDPKNPGLRHCLLNGDLHPVEFARMTSEQMASDEMKLLREKLASDASRLLRAAAAPTVAGSSLFSCKRCRKKNCTYNQLQTLSGDEPMTTYVLCYECGFRWKFN